MGRPLWIGTADGAFFFASTRHALELVERYCGASLRKRELGSEGSLLAVDGRSSPGDSFRPDMSFVEEPLPSVRAPHEREATPRRLAALTPRLGAGLGRQPQAERDEHGACDGVERPP